MLLCFLARRDLRPKRQPGVCGRVGVDCFSVGGWCDCDCGVTVRAGLTLIGLGVGSAVVVPTLRLTHFWWVSCPGGCVGVDD